MTSKEWKEKFDSGMVQDAMKAGLVSKMVMDIIKDLVALESFCEGLKGANDDLRGKLAACKKERDAWKANSDNFERMYEKAKDRYEAAEEDVRILTEAASANEDMIERARGAEKRCKKMRLAAQAYRDLCTCYRIGKNPTEKLFSELKKSREIMEEASDEE